jgi:hypothetical protein
VNIRVKVVNIKAFASGWIVVAILRPLLSIFLLHNPTVDMRSLYILDHFYLFLHHYFFFHFFHFFKYNDSYKIVSLFSFKIMCVIYLT